MSNNLTYLFQYLENEKITIDKSEFEFQVQSHSDYPNILAISDTLSFFNINNGAMKVAIDDLELLPNNFIAVLSDEKGAKKLNLISKIENDYFVTKDKNTSKITLAELNEIWSGIVLLAEKQENEIVQNTNKKIWSWGVPSITLLLFVLVVAQFKVTISTKLFIIFPIFGMLFSIAALKDLFGAKSEMLNNFCNITVSSSCASIVGSSKWKIFEIINFSDLSIVFFFSQFLGLLIFLFSGDTAVYFLMQKILLLTATPILLLSIYYQKFVEKKWCPICLVIIFITLLEITYLFLFQKDVFAISISSILIFGFVFSSSFIIWFSLKKLLTQQKELKEFQFKSTRFMRNYEVFRNSLLTTDKTNYQPLTSGNILLGNQNASLKIILVTNPFCGYCSEAHNVIEEILKKHKDSISVDFRFNFDASQSDEEYVKVHQKLIRIYFDNGQEAFLKSLHDWFEQKNHNKLFVSDKSVITDMKINLILEEQFVMNRVNNILFTPFIIINQHQFPQMYDRKELIHFMNDLIEDTFE